MECSPYAYSTRFERHTPEYSKFIDSVYGQVGNVLSRRCELAGPTRVSLSTTT